MRRRARNPRRPVAPPCAPRAPRGPLARSAGAPAASRRRGRCRSRGRADPRSRRRRPRSRSPGANGCLGPRRPRGPRPRRRRCRGRSARAARRRRAPRPRRAPAPRGRRRSGASATGDRGGSRARACRREPQPERTRVACVRKHLGRDRIARASRRAPGRPWHGFHVPSSCIVRQAYARPSHRAARPTRDGRGRPPGVGGARWTGRRSRSRAPARGISGIGGGAPIVSLLARSRRLRRLADAPRQRALPRSPRGTLCFSVLAGRRPAVGLRFALPGARFAFIG